MHTNYSSENFQSSVEDTGGLVCQTYQTQINAFYLKVWLLTSLVVIEEKLQTALLTVKTPGKKMGLNCCTAAKHEH